MNNLGKLQQVRKFRNMLFNKQKYSVIHYVPVCDQQTGDRLPVLIIILATLHGMCKVQMEGC